MASFSPSSSLYPCVFLHSSRTVNTCYIRCRWLTRFIAYGDSIHTRRKTWLHLPGVTLLRLSSLFQPLRSHYRYADHSVSTQDACLRSLLCSPSENRGSHEQLCFRLISVTLSLSLSPLLGLCPFPAVCYHARCVSLLISCVIRVRTEAAFNSCAFISLSPFCHSSLFPLFLSPSPDLGDPTPAALIPKHPLTQTPPLHLSCLTQTRLALSQPLPIYLYHSMATNVTYPPLGDALPYAWAASLPATISEFRPYDASTWTPQQTTMWAAVVLLGLELLSWLIMQLAPFFSVLPLVGTHLDRFSKLDWCAIYRSRGSCSENSQVLAVRSRVLALCL